MSNKNKTQEEVDLNHKRSAARNAKPSKKLRVKARNARRAARKEAKN